MPREWNIGKLTILSKKGDLSLPKNYRGIMLLDNAYKIIALILHQRLLSIEESLDMKVNRVFTLEKGAWIRYLQ